METYIQKIIFTFGWKDAPFSCSLHVILRAWISTLLRTISHLRLSLISTPVSSLCNSSPTLQKYANVPNEPNGSKVKGSYAKFENDVRNGPVVAFTNM